MIDGEYKKILKQYHKLSDRHILVAETDMPYSDVLKIVVLSDKIRKAGNELVGLMRKNYDQLFRTKRYRKLLSLYGNTGDKAKRKILAVKATDFLPITDGFACPLVDGYNDHVIKLRRKKGYPLNGNVSDHGTRDTPVLKRHGYCILISS